ncbi:SseB family protein [Micromonospora sp. SL1-18]|uniref:SseB family protein n=1 Tax=Micromonospora sp. SL1-18 TaxID=3399128 RepID=UPI003A4E5C3F
MIEWEPATEAEVAMRDALSAQDQQLYFRILARVDLLLPVAAEGQNPAGWGTWTTGGRTHILAFTSVTALRACLGDNVGATRRIPYADLATGWPNHEWWLAVNPGLPIEGYLPAWFVAQLSRGDVRLPGRTMGARARLERAETAARVRAGAPDRGATASPPHSAPAPVPPAPVPPAPGGRAPAIGGEPSAAPNPTPVVRPMAPGAAEPAGPPATGPPEPMTGRPGPDRPVPLDRRPGDDGPARVARTAPVRGTAGQPDPGSGHLSGWLDDLRRRPDEPDPFASTGRTDPANGRSGEPAPPPARSFFESAPGRSSRRPSSLDPVHRAGERAVPPPRLGRDGQPFPRRRPLAEPVPAQPTRPLTVDDAEATQPLRRDEPVRSFQPAPAAPAEEATQALPRRRPLPGDGSGAAERTQPLPNGPGAGAFAPDEAEELHPSIAEPVSGPPAPQRGFKPIVIEGTVIESRDLTGPEERSPTRPASGPAPEAPEPYGGATVPLYPRPAPPAPSASLLEPAAAADRGTTSSAEPLVPSEQPAASVTAPASSAAPPTPEPPTPEPAPPEPAPPAPVPPDFVPANDVEKELLGAAGSGSTDGFLSTLLLARVLLPVAADSVSESRPGDPGFVWRTEQLDGETYVVVYTSPERLADRVDPSVETVRVKFVQLIRRWPDESWSFAVNPGTPVGAKYPGEQVLALANWAAEVGLGDDPESEPEAAAAEADPAAAARPAVPPVDPSLPVTMQKAVAPSQLAYYLERGYDRVSGFVHRAGELAHLNTPAQLYDALGLSHPDSPFSPDAEEIYVLRWPAYRPSLYRIPYGGQNEAAMRAMEGWVIERPPFRGNGFAPGESSDVVAEFKVDSARLPHGAQLCRIGADGSERVVAILDADALLWRRVGES